MTEPALVLRARRLRAARGVVVPRSRIRYLRTLRRRV
jgi:hypothetical protein